MPPNDSKAGRVVFIGNIPYGVAEEQIVEILKRVGEVNHFRLVYDKETGRPKGFGFAEFADADAAASAVRNLNDHDLMGRKLRVDWSNDNGAGDAATINHPAPVPAPALAPLNGQPLPAVVPQSSTLPALPPGTDPPPNLKTGDAISRTLSSLPPAQLLDILSQMKGLVMQDPMKATELLRTAPQLGYALFQALLLLNLVDGGVLSQIIEAPGTAPPAAALPPQQPPQAVPPQAIPPQHNFPGYPPQAAPTPPVQAQPQPQAYAQPPPPQFPQLAGFPPEQQQQYAAILALTPAVIAGLPPDQRNQVVALRQAFGVPT